MAYSMGCQDGIEKIWLEYGADLEARDEQGKKESDLIPSPITDMGWGWGRGRERGSGRGGGSRISPDRIVASSGALCAPSTDIEEAGPMPTLAFEDDFTS